jgi:peptidoglycan biosynthesis protein MviN/MurJ (putative lipid II flippase)
MSQAPLDYESATEPMPHSRAGVASLVLGSLCVGALILSMFLQTKPGATNAASWRLILGVVACVFVATPIVGLIFGVAGILAKQRRRITAVIGLFLNGMVLLLLGCIIVLAYMTRDV